MGVATGCGFKEIYRFPHTILIPTPLVSVLFGSSIPTSFFILLYIIESVDSIIELVDSISRDERDVPLTQYITNA